MTKLFFALSISLAMLTLSPAPAVAEYESVLKGQWVRPAVRDFGGLRSPKIGLWLQENGKATFIYAIKRNAEPVTGTWKLSGHDKITLSMPWGKKPRVETCKWVISSDWIGLTGCSTFAGKYKEIK